MGLFLEHKERIRWIVEIATIISLYGIGSLLAWTLGSRLGFSSSGQILLIVVVLLTFPLALIINSYLKRRHNPPTTLEQSSGASPIQTENYPELLQHAEEAVQWLKSTKLASKSARDVVYQLPWFLCLGPSNSGKTSLILNSGLQLQALPSQKGLEQNLPRPTNNCQWHVSDTAILIDTAGRYIRDNGDHNEWLALLTTIKKYRLANPINGLIVTFDIRELTKANDNELEQQAKQLRARIDEVRASFKTIFPIYLLFTHVDKIDGFNLFFTAFDKEKRHQVWGATIALAQREQAHALFDTEFDYLCDALMSNRFMRLKLAGSPQEQLTVFDFPLHFAALRSKMGLFTSTLFRPNPFSDNPWLRGFYLTTALAEPTTPNLTTKSTKESYFIEELFQEQLIQDANLGESLQEKRETPQLKRKILVSAALLASILLVLAFTISLIRNRFLLNESLEKGLQVDEITRSQTIQSSNRDIAAMRVELEAMEALREKLALLDNYQDAPPLSYRYGLYAGNTINPNLRAIYFDLLNQRFFQPTVANLTTDLKAFAETKNTLSEEELGQNYDLLKAYLMLTDPSKTEPAFLANQLSRYWKKCYPAELELLAQQQLDFYTKQASYLDTPHFKGDDKIIVAARQHLTAYPAVNRFFKRITSEIDTKVDPISLETITQGRGRGWLMAKYSVPGSFTVKGYQNYMKEALASAAVEMSKEDWVMGAASVTTKDLSSDTSKLEGIYFHEYINQWQYFLRGLSVPPLKNKEDAVEALKALSASDSPLGLALAEVAQQTNFTTKTEQHWWEKLFSTNISNQSPQIVEIEKEFSPLRQFLGKNSDENSSLSQYRASLRMVEDSLESTTTDQLAQTTKMLLTGKDDIGLQKAEVSINRLLDNFTTAATKDAASACKQPLGNLRAMLYGGGYTQIEKIWQEQIYSKGHALEEGFPFTEAGSASITDLTRYLNPANGLFTQFFNDRLTNSFEEAQGKWRLKENGAFNFSPEFIDYLNNSRQLRDALFPQGGQQMEVGYELLLQPLENADVVIEIDGTRVETRRTTAQAAKFIWPAKAGTAGAKITVLQNNKVAEKAFPGEWGLFKLLSAGGAASSDGTQISLNWNIEGSSVRAVLKPASSTNPFLRRLFTQWHAPKNLRN